MECFTIINTALFLRYKLKTSLAFTQKQLRLVCGWGGFHVCTRICMTTLPLCNMYPARARACTVPGRDIKVSTKNVGRKSTFFHSQDKRLDKFTTLYESKILYEVEWNISIQNSTGTIEEHSVNKNEGLLTLTRITQVITLQQISTDTTEEYRGLIKMKGSWRQRGLPSKLSRVNLSYIST